MNKWIYLLSSITMISYLDSKNLFFKDLTSHPLYKGNHIFRPLDAVSYRDSILYIQEVDYLLIVTNNSILNLDIYTLDVVQTLTVSRQWNPDHCIMDRDAREYPCHLFGYWSKIIALSTNSSVNQLFVCHNDGRATYHNLQSINSEPSLQSKCPSMSVISLYATDNNFYVGDIENGRKILRFEPTLSEPTKVKKKNYLYTSIDSNWLQQNDYLQFVFLFENGNYVYFLLRETAAEDHNYCNVKAVKSRVARISKDDKGGTENILRNHWTTFVKATIICFDDDTANLDSSLRHIEAAFYDNERKFLYATFSSGRSEPYSTAICQYSINDIDQALDGLYMNVKDPKTPIPKLDTDCLNADDACKIRNAVRFQLKYSAIVPNTKKNLIRQNGEIWTQIQVLPIDRSSRQYDVIFVATSKNKIKKFYRKLTDNFLCYSETLSLSEYDNNIPFIRDMRIINAKRIPQLFLLVTVSNGVYKIGVEHCQFHLTEYLCIDPFCYWEPEVSKCKSIFNLAVYKLRQLPLLKDCSDGNDLYDPMWKEWSSWKTNKNENDHCDNRIRFCRKGACSNLDNNIHNYEIEVRNCSRFNKWSSWSAWSACSSTCGPGIATRQRWCFQNSGCIGDSSESRDCLIDNQCNKSNYSSADVWSGWSKCSTNCGEGIRIRTKACRDLVASTNESCKLLESKSCTENNCKEVTKYVLGDLNDGSDESLYLAKCSGNLRREDQLEVTVEYDILKQNNTFDLIWDCWSEWSNCSVYCAGNNFEDFQRTRTRSCRVDDPTIAGYLCLGQSKETDTCKDDNCLEAVMSTVGGENGFPLVYIILVGVASFTASCLLVVTGVCVYFAKRKPISMHMASNPDTNTLRRSTFVSASYSPMTHSPTGSPAYRVDPYSTDMYGSVKRFYGHSDHGPTYMPTPMVSDDYPMYPVQREQF